METSLAMWISIAVALLFTVAGLWLRLGMVARKRKEEQAAFVLRLKAEVLHQEQEKTASGQLLLDDIAPVLTALNLSVNSLDIGGADEPILQKVNTYIDRLMHISHEATRELQSRLFFRRDLHQALSDYARATGDNITITGDELPPLPTDQALTLFRVFEAVSTRFTHHLINLHARQRFPNCEVTITIHGVHPAELICTDDLLLRNRITLLNGRCTMLSREGHHAAQLIFQFAAQPTASITSLHHFAAN